MFEEHKPKYHLLLSLKHYSWFSNSTSKGSTGGSRITLPCPSHKPHGTSLFCYPKVLRHYISECSSLLLESLSISCIFIHMTRIYIHVLHKYLGLVYGYTRNGSWCTRIWVQCGKTWPEGCLWWTLALPAVIWHRLFQNFACTCYWMVFRCSKLIVHLRWQSDLWSLLHCTNPNPGLFPCHLNATVTINQIVISGAQLILSTLITSNSMCSQSFGTMCTVLQLVMLFGFGNCLLGAKNMNLK